MTRNDAAMLMLMLAMALFAIGGVMALMGTMGPSDELTIVARRLVVSNACCLVGTTLVMLSVRRR